MTVDEDDLAELHARLNQLERDLIHRTTWLLLAVFLAIFLVLVVAVLLAVVS